MAQKPRYFTGIPHLCPFDYKTLAQKDGLIINKASLTITEAGTKQILGIINKDGARIESAFIAFNDTSFKVSKIAKKYYAFDIIQPIGNYSVIKYWNTKDADKNNVQSFYSTLSDSGPSFAVSTNLKNYKVEKNKDSKDSIKVNDTKDFYLIKNDDIQNFSKEFEYKKNKWSMGLLVLPVKLRVFADTTGQFEFSDGFSLGTSFSWTLKHNWVNDKTYNLVLYAGVSSISVDSLKTRGSTNADKIPAFSPAIGFMIEKSGIQIGAFWGLDFPIGKIQKNWIYRNRPWFGIGLGFSIFKIQSAENIQSGNN